MIKIKQGFALIGHPAAGKSTTGKIVAAELSCIFLEQDTYVEALKEKLLSPQHVFRLAMTWKIYLNGSQNKFRLFLYIALRKKLFEGMTAGHH